MKRSDSTFSFNVKPLAPLIHDTNELYIDKIINGKQEVTDFLTGQRAEKDETDWLVTERPDLRIIEPE